MSKDKEIKSVGSHNRKKTIVRKKFGMVVRAHRLLLDLTQEELAELCGLHPTYIGSVERGERNISLENIVILASGLNCKTADLVSDL